MQLYICETDAQANCITAVSSSTTRLMDKNDNATFTTLAAGSDDIAFDPAVSRVFMRFTNASGNPVDATSVAARALDGD